MERLMPSSRLTLWSLEGRSNENRAALKVTKKRNNEIIRNMKKNKKSEKISKRVAANGKKVVAYVVIALIVMFVLIFAGAAYLFE